ncbi:reverse transcriptase domain-containing protein, partial [Tanacetum coccineum]
DYSLRFGGVIGILYRRSFLKPWLRYVRPLQANYVIREIHEGSCSIHAGPQSVVAKAMRLGYYWPTMHRDARDMIHTRNDCQIHRPVPRNLQQPLTPITAPWPFYKWGMDIADPFPEGPGKVKFLIVAMDYFTKWIEAKVVATITDNQAKKFVWDNIVCRFGLPGEIVSDNGKQFNDNPFKDCYFRSCEAHDPDYVPEPIYPEYIPLEDEHEFPAEEQPLPPVDSPTVESPGYVTESDPEEDPEEYEDDETEDGLVDYWIRIFYKRRKKKPKTNNPRTGKKGQVKSKSKVIRMERKYILGD